MIVKHTEVFESSCALDEQYTFFFLKPGVQFWRKKSRQELGCEIAPKKTEELEDGDRDSLKNEENAWDFNEKQSYHTSAIDGER